jgi:endonuclease/exonuclease/phosphatase family metal-dependent hydrolase
MKIISYNLRFASEEDPQPWSRRRGPMLDLLRGLGPDVLGTQEGLDHQLADIAGGLGDHYRLIAEHRGDGAQEENSAIFYDRRTVELVAVEHRWLSDTPDVPGSRSWGTQLPRMFSVAWFRRIDDGIAFTVISTHFDYQPTAAQVKSAKLLAERAAGLDRAEPLIVMGDFNTGEGSEPYDILTAGGLRDAYLAARERGPRLGTFNNYGAPDPAGDRIDWILVNDRIVVESARMVDVAPGGQYPSDHLPVEAVVSF